MNPDRKCNVILPDTSIILLTKNSTMRSTILKIDVILFILLFALGCKKERVDLPIVSELPIIYTGCFLQEGNSTVIQDQIGLDTIFNSNLITQIEALQNINFSKYNVLVGAESYTRGITKLEHHLVKSNNAEFIYTLKVYYDLTLPAGTFYYGILIDKLPSNVSVNFVVKKINE
jgi:hypothetical protein